MMLGGAETQKIKHKQIIERTNQTSVRLKSLEPIRIPYTVWQKQDARAQCFGFFDDFFPSWLAGEIQYWTNARSWGAEIQTRAAPD